MEVNGFLIKKHKKDHWKIIIKVFTMLHGQAHTERSFSVNKETVVENLHFKSLSAYHLVYDAINLSGKGVHEIDLPNKLVTFCIASYSCYHALKESRSDKQTREIQKKKDSARKNRQC